MDEHTKAELQQLPEGEKLFNLAYWSKTISRVLVVIGILRLIFYLFTNFSSVYTNPTDDSGWIASMLLSSVSSGIPILVYFFMLQAIGEILYLVIDIKEKLLNEDSDAA